MLASSSVNANSSTRIDCTTAMGPVANADGLQQESHDLCRDPAKPCSSVDQVP